MRTLMLCTAIAAGGLGFAAAACESPSVATIPEGATATRDQILSAQGEIKAYMAAMEQFLACINAELEAEGEDAPAEFKSLMITRHNAAVTEMEGVAAAFNEQVRAWRAANPEPAANQ